MHTNERRVLQSLTVVEALLLDCVQVKCMSFSTTYSAQDGVGVQGGRGLWSPLVWSVREYLIFVYSCPFLLLFWNMKIAYMRNCAFSQGKKKQKIHITTKRERGQQTAWTLNTDLLTKCYRIQLLDGNTPMGEKYFWTIQFKSRVMH